MKAIRPTKILISLLFAGCILFSNSIPLYGLDTYISHEIKIDEADSTKAKPIDLSSSNSTENKDTAKKSKSTAQYSYSFIYFLISQFMKMNPLSRP